MDTAAPLDVIAKSLTDQADDAERWAGTLRNMADQAEARAAELRALAKGEDAAALPAGDSRVIEDGGNMTAELPRIRVTPAQLERLQKDATTAGYSKVAKYVRYRLFGS